MAAVMMVYMNGLKIGFFVFLLTLCSCVTQDYQSRPNAITIMTYNVENLFDNIDDPDKEDETYLPLKDKDTAQHRSKCQTALKEHWRRECLEMDWTDAKIESKMKRLADVILQVNDGKGPDILVVQEVENLNVLERLRINHLQAAEYNQSILLEGPDVRGVDVGMMSRLPLAAAPQLHILDLTQAAKKAGRKKGATRGILQARFRLPDRNHLTVFGVHLPSQGSPTPYRRVAIDKLNSLQKKLPRGEYSIAAGDFNISAEEEAREKLFSRDLAAQWYISHHLGCKDCLGTHNYRGSWSFLDAILFSKNFKYGQWLIDKESIRVPNQSIYQINHWGAPARFDGGEGQKGVSDHWPLAVDIIPNRSRGIQ
jgi:endonuclease/exonuclease/phosphatase family metal-dependent hydrolase